MVNRLASSTSTYLLQHAQNPVDWWPWGPEAFAEAARLHRPVLLSIGYASCHWCHVMARESFADEDTAAQINRDFVAVKVDREERPDVDAVYMSATQALTGSGGWPMTCFLTPDREPFYAGTYYPPTAWGQQPSFRQLLSAITVAWRDDHEQVVQAAGRIRQSLSEVSLATRVAGDAAGEDRPPDHDELTATARSLIGQIDRVNGGFPGAPKFPPAMVCEFLLRNYERTADPSALEAVTLTLEGMARGGIHDQLGGGFARYSVDSRWHVPHFEKMLDDNALLLQLYAHHARRTGSALSARITGHTADFLVSELRTDGGAFAASLDADTAGVEGATYVWNREQFARVLGESDALRAATVFGVDENDHPPELRGAVLRLRSEPDDPAWFEQVRLSLLAARNQRPQPARDEIVVLRSNGLAIRALAEAGAFVGRADWVEAAAGAARYLLEIHRVGGRWRRSSRAGVVGPGAAVLVDHADLAAGLLALFQADGEAAWLVEAVSVLDLALERFGSPDGGFNDTADDAEQLFLRPRDPFDGASPSGASSIVDALLTAGSLTGRTDFLSAAQRAMSTSRTVMMSIPRSAGWHLAGAEALAAGPLQIAVAGHLDSGRAALAAAARAAAPGGSVIVVGEPDSAELLLSRPMIDGRPAAYVCRGFVCDRPVTEIPDLISLLTAPR